MSIFHKSKGKTTKDVTYKLDTKEEILEFILSQGLLPYLPWKAQRNEHGFYIPELQMDVEVVVNNFMKQENGCTVHLSFFMYSELYQREFYESSSGIGSDMNTAVGMAVSSYVFSFCNGLKKLLDGEPNAHAGSTFKNKENKWNVYFSDIVGMGEQLGDQAEVDKYWSLLKDEICKRLGNKSFVFVKVYSSKSLNSCTCEVRLDDEPIPELSQMVESVVKNHEVKNFASEKQFIFLQNTSDEKADNPYGGKQGEKVFYQKVLTYLKMFSSVKTQEDYDQLLEQASVAIQDRTLAEECYSFLPELCAEFAYQDDVQFSDCVQIYRSETDKELVYQSQLSDYYPMRRCLARILESRELGEDTNRVYQMLISVSATYSVIQQAVDKGSNLKDLRLTGLSYSVSDKFELR